MMISTVYAICDNESQQHCVCTQRLRIGKSKANSEDHHSKETE